jgi:spermidine synthase
MRNFIQFAMTKILEQFDSKFNGKVKVVKNLAFGTYLQAENLTQSGGIIRDIWKTVFKKAKASEWNIDTALILGLGGGTLVGVIKKQWPDADITGVDIDEKMVEMGKKYLKLNANDVEIVISDAMKFCKDQIQLGKHYDLICIDMYNGEIYPPQFEETDFLRLVFKLLSDNGVAVFNRTYYDDRRKLAVNFSKKLSEVFSTNDAIYPEANVMFVCTK